MARAKKTARGQRTGWFAMRLDPEVVARIDALAKLMSEPWRDATRTDVCRAALLGGLPALEARYAKKGGAP